MSESIKKFSTYNDEKFKHLPKYVYIIMPCSLIDMIKYDYNFDVKRELYSV